MLDSLAKLERAVEAAARSVKAAKVKDSTILVRIASYQEIIRRQNVLVADIGKASARQDWREVARITDLVHNASLMIKVDAGFLISNLRRS